MPQLQGELGSLERAVMEFIWSVGDREVTVRDVLDSPAGRGLAYTTVMTVLERLSRKRYLSRRRQGRPYLYRVRRSREDHTGALFREILSNVGDRREAMLGFVRGVQPEDLEELRRVIRTVERERRRN